MDSTAINTALQRLKAQAPTPASGSAPAMYEALAARVGTIGTHRMTDALKAATKAAAEIKCGRGTGLLLIGSVGCGKTVALRVMRQMIGRRAVFLAASEMAVRYAAEGMEYITGTICQYDTCDAFIDDLGAEDAAKSYGNPFPMREIIARRYRVWQGNGFLTHFSTNLSGADITKKYDERSIDRLREMCERVRIDGESMRGAKERKVLTGE